MNLQNFTEGINIIAKYFNKKDGYHIGAEHDQFYVYQTDRELSEDDIKKMIELGWFQEVDAKGEEFSLGDYDKEEGWSCFV